MDIILERILSLIPRKPDGKFVHGSKKEFADKIGLNGSNVISDWIGGRNDGYKNYVYKIAYIYNVSPEWILGETDDPELPHNKKSPGFSTEAARLASDYDDMDKWGKKAVRSIADTELSRILDEDEQDQGESEIIQFRPRVKQIPQLGTSFAAGAGEVDTGNAWSLYTVPEDSPADFAIRITGDSMEPYLEDGSIALCVRRNPKDKEVGAFLIDGDFICKQMCIDYAGALHLFSLNRARKDMDRHIPRDDIERQIMCFGTVLMDKVPPLPID